MIHTDGKQTIANAPARTDRYSRVSQLEERLAVAETDLVRARRELHEANEMLAAARLLIEILDD